MFVFICISLLVLITLINAGECFGYFVSILFAVLLRLLLSGYTV